MSNTTITIINGISCSNTVTMNRMIPLQVGRIVKCSTPYYLGSIVMRTASTTNFEVMHLSYPKANSCWTNTEDCKSIIVEPLDAELVVNIK